MGRDKNTMDRMNERVDELIENFDVYWKHYDNNPLFSGPSTYFHHKTLSLLRAKGLPNVISNDQFFEYLYSTLTSWGFTSDGGNQY